MAKPEEMFVYPRENDSEVWKQRVPPATPKSHTALLRVGIPGGFQRRQPLEGGARADSPAALWGGGGASFWVLNSRRVN